MKIGFLAHGPASGNALHPLIQALASRHEIHLYSFHPYVSALWGSCLLDTKEGLNCCSKDLDVLIYGTGSGHAVETHAPEFGVMNDILTVSILDTFCDTTNSIKSRFPFVPNFIICPNVNVKEIVVSADLGLKPSSILPYGNPHLDRLNVWKETFEKGDVFAPYRIAFISEPSTNDSLSETSQRAQSLFKDLLRVEGNLIESIIFCPHPRESKGFIQSVSPSMLARTNSFDEALKADIVMGFESIILYEMNHLNKITIFAKDITDIELILKNRLFELANDFVPISYEATKQIVRWLETLVSP